MKPLRLPFIVFLFSTALWASPIPGQVDTFSTSSTAGWTVGASATSLPTVISTGGPAGAGDGFLSIASDGSGASGRLTVFNTAQWSGDFLAAGINMVTMDLKDLGSTSLSIRVALRTTTARNPPGFISSTPFLLSADGAWHHATFLLDAADLTQVGTGITLTSLLSNVGEFRILNEIGTGNLDGDPIVAQLGIDNIRAAASAVPEPGTAFLFCGAFVAVWCMRRRPGKSL